MILDVIRDRIDRQEVLMPADPSRPGRYVVEVPVLRDGEYDLEVAVPERPPTSGCISLSAASCPAWKKIIRNATRTSCGK